MQVLDLKSHEPLRMKPSVGESSRISTTRSTPSTELLELLQAKQLPACIIPLTGQGGKPTSWRARQESQNKTLSGSPVSCDETQHSIETEGHLHSSDEVVGPTQHQVHMHIGERFKPESCSALNEFFIKPTILRLCEMQVILSLSVILVAKALCLPPAPQLWVMRLDPLQCSLIGFTKFPGTRRDLHPTGMDEYIQHPSVRVPGGCGTWGISAWHQHRWSKN